MRMRKCHPLRVVRTAMGVVLVLILVTTAWQYLAGGRGLASLTSRASSGENIMNYHPVEQNPIEHNDDSHPDLDAHHHYNHRHPHPNAVPALTPILAPKAVRAPYAALAPNAVPAPPADAHRPPDAHPPIPPARRGIDRKAQALLDYIGTHLDVHYDVRANEGGRFHVDVTLRNAGSQNIRPCCWSIVLYHMKWIDTHVFNSGTPVPLRSEFGADVLLKAKQQTSGFEMQHVNGYNFRLTPTNSFAGLPPGESVTLRISGGGWAVSYSEVVPNWYVANDLTPTEPRLIQSTAGEDMRFVGKFDTLAKSTRFESDGFQPLSAEERFRRNKIHNMGKAPELGVVPTPAVVRRGEGGQRVRVDGGGWSIHYSGNLRDSAHYLRDQLKTFTPADVVQSDAGGETHCKPKLITLRLSDAPLDLGPPTEPPLVAAEGYTLTVSPENDCISITGPTPAGVLYGAITLVSLGVGGGGWGKGGGAPTSYSFPAVEVVDAPRYEYRGVMVDVVRQFHTKAEMLKLMEALAMYKLNKLHLHLGDDEGWRLEIPGLPELTEFGGRRGHDPKEVNHVNAMLGSGPFTNGSGSGFYTVRDYHEMLQRAHALNIELVPEFDMPGHSHAAIKSMEARYRRLKDEGDEKGGLHYLLSDLADQSVYKSGQFFTDSAINPCLESSYRFVDLVIKAVVNIYKNISPLRRFHFGGDEVPADAYTASPACTQFLLRHPKLSDTKSLKTYFVRRVTALIARHGLTPHGWEDAYSMETGYPIPRADMEGPEVVSQAWYNIWESGFAMRAYQYANLGYKVVMSPTTSLYFDNPQEPDPEDFGLHWAARYIDTKHSFLFMPEAMYENIDFEFGGKPINRSMLCGTKKIECPALTKPRNIIGLEGATWSELIRTPARLDSMLWPRLLALAERAWHRAAWEQEPDQAARAAPRRRDWARFANALGHKELERLEGLGVDFYLPRPGVRQKNVIVHVNTMFPGLIVQVSSDEGRTWSDFDRTATYAGHTWFATRSYDSKRRSVPVKVDLV